MNEEQLVIDGLKWLQDNFWARDQEVKSSQGLATRYAQGGARVIRRVKDFIAESDENLQFLHDHLLQNNYEDDIFQVFYKIWSDRFKLGY